jgi:hypothetical protein
MNESHRSPLEVPHGGFNVFMRVRQPVDSDELYEALLHDATVRVSALGALRFCVGGMAAMIPC